TGGLGKKIAGRMSFSGTERDGTIYNVKTQHRVNGLDNIGLRGQLLFAPSDKIAVNWTTDYTRQRPESYTQVVAGVAPTPPPATPPVLADCRRSPLRAAELQCVRPSDRRRFAVALLSGSRGHGRECRLEARTRPADLDELLAVLGLESFERPGFHRSARDDDL